MKKNNAEIDELREYWLTYINEDKKYPKDAIIMDIFDTIEELCNLKSIKIARLENIRIDHKATMRRHGIIK